MKKGTWTLIMSSAPATSQSSTGGLSMFGKEVWEWVWDTGGEEKGECVAGAEGKAGSVGS
jgi:hypothetical protein